MCDEQTNKDAEAWLRRKGLTRRDFHKAGAAAALTVLLPPVANALDVTGEDVLVDTPDGKLDGYFVRPSSGSHAGVIVWPDVKGIRPAFRAMGKRLAQSGYSVLVVNPYYRTHQGQIIEEGESYRDPDVRARIMPHRQSLTPETVVIDGKALVAFLASQRSVDTCRKSGTTGYCMTGSSTMRRAAAIPDRIGAGGSFHGGGLASDRDDSPHLLAPQMKAAFLIAIAESDDTRNPEARHLLRKAFDAADVEAEIEVYEGTAHGWCPPDSEVYDEAQADRAWNRLLALFERELA